MITVYVHVGGETRLADRVDPAWLTPDAGAVVWVDLTAPGPGEAKLLSDVFGFHELAVEDALSESHHPKVEAYDGYLYLILHGIAFQAAEHCFATHDVDFFVGLNYLVTVHDGTSRSVARLRDLCLRNERVLAEGPMALAHRVIDGMVDNYRPEVDQLESRIDEVEDDVFERPEAALLRVILVLKSDVGSLRRVTIPQRDVVGRLARREFPAVTEALAYRFRDVYDHLVRLADEAGMLHDRLAALVDAHLANQSNQLSRTMKVLTVIATIFMPLTLVTGLFGMNVELPHLMGLGTIPFWTIVAGMLGLSGLMLWVFRKRGWL